MKRRLLIYILASLLIIFVLFPPFKNYLKSHLIDNTVVFSEKMSESGHWFKRKFSFLSNISLLQKQNDDLAQKITELEIDKSKISELENENQLLKTELGFKEEDKDEVFLPAKIIGREPISFFDYIVINKGAKDNIKSGMAVVSQRVLVGQVKEVYENQSKVTLITSKDSVILAMLENSRAKGVLRGGISGLILEDITQDIDYQKGENVVTSGLDGELKPGILIGKTSNIESSNSDLFKNIAVESIVDLSNLELVFVLQ